jgi:hypothetical protein
MVVCLNGEQGAPFDPHQGTKQGNEMSPILFGLFVEELHHLLKENYISTRSRARVCKGQSAR